MNIEDCVSYPIALALKACGFDEPCIAQWSVEPDGKPMLLGSTVFVFSNAELKGRDVAAPLLYHAQKWLRKRAIEVDVNPIFSHGSRDGYDCDVYDDFSGHPAIRGTLPFAETYEQALSAGLSAALELIKKRE